MTKTKIYLTAFSMLIASFTYAQEENPFKMKWDNGFKLEKRRQELQAEIWW